MIAFTVLPFIGLAYASWHVWNILPFGNIWRWTAVVVGILLFMTMFLNFSGTIDSMPLKLGTLTYEVGNSGIFVLLYLVMIFLVMDIAHLVHLLPRSALYGNGYSSLAVLGLMLALFIYGNVHYF